MGMEVVVCVGFGVGGKEGPRICYYISGSVKNYSLYLSGWLMGPRKDFACRLSSPGVDLPTLSAGHSMKCRIYEEGSLVEFRDKIYHRRKRSHVSYRTIQLKYRKV